MTGWVARMAWRDSRGQRWPLVLSVVAIALGIGAVVAIRAFSARMEQAMALHARHLLGADISVRSLHPFTPEADAFLDTLPGEQVREIRFLSMVRFPAADATRLAHIHALSDAFPFYGTFDAEPADALEIVLTNPNQAIVEDQLLDQLDLQIGDTLQLGYVEYQIAGRLRHVSGVSPLTTALVGPRIYVAKAGVADTGLLRADHLGRYYAHFRLDEPAELAMILDRPRHVWSDLRLEWETVADREAVTGQWLTNLNRYLSLGSFVALLLGGIGLAAAVRLHVRQKLVAMAVLRCLGAPARQAFGVYVWQVGTIALIGAMGGTLLGYGLQHIFPWLLADFLPVPLTDVPARSLAGLGVLYGVGLAVAFACDPLLPLRHTPPLHALRVESDDVQRSGVRDPWQWGVRTLLVIGALGFAIAHTGTVQQGIWVVVGLGVVWGLLAGLARVLVWGARHAARACGPFTWRHGIANLHRPGNQTRILLWALGLGAFLLGVLAFTQHNLLRVLGGTDGDGRPNLILFDIQPDQVDAIRQQVHDLDLAHIETSPIVTMRLQEVNGQSVSTLRDDPERDIPDWILFREYRSTYREALSPTEPVIAGTWQGRVTDASAVVPISIEQGMAQHLGIGLGAQLIFNLQGVPIQTRVTSIRQVDWRSMRTNFFVVFPVGVLESAPQYFAMVVRASDATQSAALQNAISRTYPNVSAFDLRMWAESLDDLMDRATAVIRFIAWLSIVAGLWVLSSLIAGSRYERQQEDELWRTLGATRRQINHIMAAEYGALGFIAALSGTLLAWGTSWALARRVFDMTFHTAHAPWWAIPLTITATTILVGLGCNRWFGLASRNAHGVPAPAKGKAHRLR